MTNLGIRSMIRLLRIWMTKWLVIPDLMVGYSHGNRNALVELKRGAE